MKSRIITIFVLGSIIFSPVSFAQVTFQKTFGGTGLDYVYSVQQTFDGGYALCGYSMSFGSGMEDIYLIKTNANGNIQWSKIFGGTSYDVSFSIQQTADSGYIISGATGSFGIGLLNVYLIKTDINGNTLWEKTYGQTFSDAAWSVKQTADGGFIITGFNSPPIITNSDVYLIKTDAVGNLVWAKGFGGTNIDEGFVVEQTADGGYVIIGRTGSFGAGSIDIYLIKTDNTGNLLWSKTFGGAGDDWGYSLKQTNDGGYIITGYTNSFGTGDYDACLIKTDSIGSLLWSKTYGGINSDGGYSIKQTSDGGFIVSGGTGSFGAGNSDSYLFKTDSNGVLLWSKTFGGAGGDGGGSVQQTIDGGFIIAGTTNSFGAGSLDIYLIKTDSLGNSGCNQGNAATIVTTPTIQVTSPATVVSFPTTIETSPSAIVSSGGTVTTLCTTVGIPPLSFGEGSGVRLFPNPSSGNFLITFEKEIKKGSIEVVNLLGEIIYSENISNESEKEIHLTKVSPGIYIVKVATGENLYCRKIIIEGE